MKWGQGGRRGTGDRSWGHCAGSRGPCFCVERIVGAQAGAATVQGGSWPGPSPFCSCWRFPAEMVPHPPSLPSGSWAYCMGDGTLCPPRALPGPAALMEEQEASTGASEGQPRSTSEGAWCTALAPPYLRAQEVQVVRRARAGVALRVWEEGCGLLLTLSRPLLWSRVGAAIALEAGQAVGRGWRRGLGPRHWPWLGQVGTSPAPRPSHQATPTMVAEGLDWSRPDLCRSPAGGRAGAVSQGSITSSVRRR